MQKENEKNYIIIQIISDLINVYQQEEGCNEGSLTERDILRIIDYLYKLKNL